MSARPIDNLHGNAPPPPLAQQPQQAQQARVAADWAKAPERSNMLMLRIMSWISLRLGRRAGRVILHLIASYFLLFAPASVKASRHYLNRVLGRSATRRDCYRHFFTFAATIHDRIYLLNQRFDLFDIRIHGEDLMQQALDAGQGAFLLGGHLGSFEAIRAIGRRQPNLRVAMVMFEANARKINDMLAAINPSAQQDIIALGQLDSMLKVQQHLDAGTMVGMLADRTIGKDVTCPVTLLGSPAGIPVGPFRMAAMLRRPVFFMTGLYLGGNRYDIHFEQLADFSQLPAGQRNKAVQEAIALYAQRLEQHCTEAPYNWFNFFDFWRSNDGVEPGAGTGPES